MNKPNGQYLLPNDRSRILEFARQLPVRKMGGIGKVTEKILKALGINTCGDLVCVRKDRFAKTVNKLCDVVPCADLIVRYDVTMYNVKCLKSLVVVSLLVVYHWCYYNTNTVYQPVLAVHISSFSVL